MRNNAKHTLDSDVVVIGAGPAGFGAAVAAARQGLNVCLLESGDIIGGIMATCPGMPIGAAYPNGMSIGGILDDFLDRLYTMNPPAAEKRKCRLTEFGPEVFYDHEVAIFTLFEMLQEAGVNVLLNATAFEPILDENKVSGVIYYDKNGKNTISSRVLIDCSGDGDVAAKAGVSFEKGDDIFSGKKFSDGIVCCDNAVDNVCRGSNISEYIALIGNGLYYQVPFRCMLPKHIENLLFAGRCISADSVALASVRGMATCMGLGQAAGTAAAKSIRERKRIQNINYEELIQELREHGVNGLN